MPFLLPPALRLRATRSLLRGACLAALLCLPAWAQAQRPISPPDLPPALVLQRLDADDEVHCRDVQYRWLDEHGNDPALAHWQLLDARWLERQWKGCIGKRRVERSEQRRAARLERSKRPHVLWTGGYNGSIVFSDNPRATARAPSALLGVGVRHYFTRVVGIQALVAGTLGKAFTGVYQGEPCGGCFGPDTVRGSGLEAAWLSELGLVFGGGSLVYFGFDAQLRLGFRSNEPLVVQFEATPWSESETVRVRWRTPMVSLGGRFSVGIRLGRRDQGFAEVSMSAGSSPSHDGPMLSPSLRAGYAWDVTY